MSNFETNYQEYQDYAQFANSAESLIYSDPKTSISDFGIFAEQLTQIIFKLDGLTDWHYSQADRIDKLTHSSNDYPIAFTKALDDIRRMRNKAAHDSDFHPSVELALEIDKKAYLIWAWFLEVFSQDTPTEYKKPQDQKQILVDQEAKIAELTAKLEKLQSGLSKNKVTPEQREQRRQINVQFAKTHPINEAETRELIDQQLKNAGWEVDSVNLNNWTKGTLPEKGKNMAIAEWVLPNKKRADYALFAGTKLIGIIEAKEWGMDIAGQFAQPKEYSRLVQSSEDYDLVDKFSDEYQVPFIYTANGRPYVKQYQQKSGIWFWDARNSMESSYALETFHSPEDLLLKLTATPKKKADANLKNDDLYPNFANRDYQVEAINSIEKAIEAGQRRILLAMATGTGKTRTALSLMYRLLKHKRARRILYLVDRRSLGNQTANAIKDNKVGNLSLASIYGMKELGDKLPEASTKIQIATVQGMIKRLFYNEENKEKPSVGMYDFIIVDEAHRGYNEDKEFSDKEYQMYDQNEYISLYRRVVDYFDATAIGMTATPALQTTQIFGQPVYSYSYQQAVLDGYLVDHNAPKIIKTKLSQEGIHFKKGKEIDLFDQDNQTINKEVLPDNMNFEVKDFNRRVVTKSFNEVVCDYLAQYLNPNDPGMGKTIIFAANDNHADMVVDLLKKSFKKIGNPVSDDAVEKITGSIRDPEMEIKRYKNEQFPNIAVTVDLLSTGVDVPEISNVVFLRRVQSRILYEQMLGRATRLCPESNKSYFEIYDAVGIYEAMNKVTDMKPVVTNPKHDVNYFVNRKEEFFELNDQSQDYQVDMAGAIERKVKRLDDKKRKEFEHLAEVDSVERWAASLSKLSKDNFMQQWSKIEILNNLKATKPKQYISKESDELIKVERGYGKGNQAPQDYIDSFNNFISTHINEIPALNIIATRPAELTLSELKQIQLKLEQEGFKVNELQDAWKNVSHVQTTADIISFIRQAAIGSPLVDHETRIKNAMQKVYGLADWNVIQKKWLKYIENQLLSSTVLGPNTETAFDDNRYFKNMGGYKQAQKVFPDHADDIIKILNDNLYAQGV